MPRTLSFLTMAANRTRHLGGPQKAKSVWRRGSQSRKVKYKIHRTTSKKGRQVSRIFKDSFLE